MKTRYRTESLGCPLPNDGALALAVVPVPMAKTLRKLLAKLHWQLELCSSPGEAASRFADGSAAVLFCMDTNWREAVAGVSAITHPPVVLVIAQDNTGTHWMDILTAGAFSLNANPVRMTELLPLLNHAWNHWHQPNAS